MAGESSDMWTEAALRELIASRMGDDQIIVVANREPYQHRFAGDSIECIRPASGMAAALDPVICASGGIWVAHGSGDADRLMTDEHDHIRVPPERPCYTLRRVWLTKELEEGYYHGLSNEGLWPLCHVTFTRPNFEERHWESYCRVNAQFADAVIEEAGDRPTFVFIQDYHFGMLPRYLKDRREDLIVAQFWHIPWPNPETFRVFPWKEELLEGLLGNDLLGFHLRYHCQNFLETVDRTIEARIDQETSEVIRGGKSTLVRPFPISIDFEKHQSLAASAEVEREMQRFGKVLQLEDKILGVGIDRIDYTKGIPERIRAIDASLEQHPEYRQKLVFVQVGVPSRQHVPQYQAVDLEIDRLVERVNWRWSTGRWRPVVYWKRHFGPIEMMALHRLARFCIVSSLHDGMNLVAKEFVASRLDRRGILLLSRFAGSSRELTDAVQFNPFAVGELTAAIVQAVEMEPAEQERRMERMQAAIQENNVYRWAGKILSTLLKIETPETS
jgi:trehalose 6-phosphate synthase